MEVLGRVAGGKGEKSGLLNVGWLGAVNLLPPPLLPLLPTGYRHQLAACRCRCCSTHRAPGLHFAIILLSNIIPLFQHYIIMLSSILPLCIILPSNIINMLACNIILSRNIIIPDPTRSSSPPFSIPLRVKSDQTSVLFAFDLMGCLMQEAF